jgi:hypothetical protein
MTPIEFVIHDGDSQPNMPVLQVAEAMYKDIIIRGAEGDFEVLSYFYDDGQMVLEIGPKTEQE